MLEAKENGHLSISKRQAIIKLIEKKYRDKRFIKNWRPISLFNVDLKIISKALSDKLKKVLPDLIYSRKKPRLLQTYILVKVGDKYLMLLKLLKKNCKVFLVAMDIEKAFVSLDHDFLIFTLEKYGFGKNFVLWIKILLRDRMCCVNNGGTTKKYFSLGRGARQGDPR